MNFNIWELFTFLIVHWLADFVCQSDWQAKNKSVDMAALISHTMIYSAIFFIPMWVMYLAMTPNITEEAGFNKAFAFCLITFVIHTAQDYHTSRLNKFLLESDSPSNVHNFFVSVGADQVFHYAQLLLTYQLLK